MKKLKNIRRVPEGADGSYISDGLEEDSVMEQAYKAKEAAAEKKRRILRSKLQDKYGSINPESPHDVLVREDYPSGKVSDVTNDDYLSGLSQEEYDLYMEDLRNIVRNRIPNNTLEDIEDDIRESLFATGAVNDFVIK